MTILAIVYLMSGGLWLADLVDSFFEHRASHLEWLGWSRRTGRHDENGVLHFSLLRMKLTPDLQNQL